MCAKQLIDVHFSLLSRFRDAQLVRKNLAPVSKAHRKRRGETPPPETINDHHKPRGRVQPLKTTCRGSIPGEERTRGGGYIARGRTPHFHGDFKKEKRRNEPVWRENQMSIVFKDLGKATLKLNVDSSLEHLHIQDSEQIHISRTNPPRLRLSPQRSDLKGLLLMFMVSSHHSVAVQ